MRKRIEYISIAVAFLFVYLYSMNVKNNQIKEQAINYTSMMSYKESENNRLIRSNEIKAAAITKSSQNAISMSLAMKEFSKELEGFKRAQSLVKSEILTEIKGLSTDFENSPGEFSGIQLIDSMYVHVDTVSKYFIRTPKKVNYSDDWISFDATVNKDFTLDSLSLINKFDITIGSKKQDKPLSFLRKKEPVVEMKSYNPYSSIPYINNVIFKDDKKGAGKIVFSKPAIFAYGFISSTLINKL
jgi:hypothetical protein